MRLYLRVSSSKTPLITPFIISDPHEKGDSMIDSDTDDRRIEAIKYSLHQIKERKRSLKIATNIPLDTPIIITHRYKIEAFKPESSKRIVEVKSIDSLNLICLIYASEKQDSFTNYSNDFNIPLIQVMNWKILTKTILPLTVKYENKTDLYKQLFERTLP